MENSQRCEKGEAAGLVLFLCSQIWDEGEISSCWISFFVTAVCYLCHALSPGCEKNNFSVL